MRLGDNARYQFQLDNGHSLQQLLDPNRHQWTKFRLIWLFNLQEDYNLELYLRVHLHLFGLWVSAVH